MGPPPSTSYGYDPYGGPPLVKAGDARTGPLPFHPMGVGDVLDGAFKLLKANARTILLIVAAIIVPLQFISAFAVRDQVGVGVLNLLRDPTLLEGSNPDVGLGGSIVSLISSFLGLLTGPLIDGAVCLVCARSYVGGEMTAGVALRRALRRFLPLLAASFLAGMIKGLGLLLCVLPGLLAIALYSAVTPAVMLEDLGPIKAMRRSWRLLQPRMWPVLGIAILARIIAGLLGNLLGGVPSLAGTFLGGSFAWLFIALGSVLSSLVSAPIVAIVSTLLYFDGRIRNEGFDLQMMADDLERSGPG